MTYLPANCHFQDLSGRRRLCRVGQRGDEEFACQCSTAIERHSASNSYCYEHADINLCTAHATSWSDGMFNSITPGRQIINATVSPTVFFLCMIRLQATRNRQRQRQQNRHLFESHMMPAFSCKPILSDFITLGYVAAHLHVRTYFQVEVRCGVTHDLQQGRHNGIQHKVAVT